MVRVLIILGINHDSLVAGAASFTLKSDSHTRSRFILEQLRRAPLQYFELLRTVILWAYSEIQFIAVPYTGISHFMRSMFSLVAVALFSHLKRSLF